MTHMLDEPPRPGFSGQSGSTTAPALSALDGDSPLHGIRDSIHTWEERSMTNCPGQPEPPAGSNLPEPARGDAPDHDLGQLEHYPELIPVLTQAVDEVIKSSNINRQRDADLVEDVERAATAAALVTYQRLEVWAVQASDADDEARRTQAESVAAAARVIAERVSDAATEVHDAEDALAEQLAQVAANAASDLAALGSHDEETAASTAAALVVRAVSEAASVNNGARASAALGVAQAAAAAAASVVEESASTAWDAESDVIANALDRHQDALKTCYQVAAAAAQAVLTHPSASGPSDPHPVPPQIHRKPA
jgi:hypothetical protein